MHPNALRVYPLLMIFDACYNVPSLKQIELQRTPEQMITNLLNDLHHFGPGWFPLKPASLCFQLQFAAGDLASPCGHERILEWCNFKQHFGKCGQINPNHAKSTSLKPYKRHRSS